ncbi:MAG TPA: hypothetical protein VN753_16055 [Terracidiphilus sp.]|nr:hypothetical protein [Terracidiphilus sp.]
MSWLGIAAALLVGLLTGGSRVQDEKLPADQSQLLESIRVSALQYTKNLPNFICTQTTNRRVTDASGFPAGMTGVSTSGRGVLGMPSGITSGGNDTIEEHLTFYNQSEHYEVISVNGESISGRSHLEFAGAVSAGEFGSALENIFEPSTNTAFSWNQDSSIKGRRVHVLSFQVPKEHGNLVMYRRGDQQILVPYSGRVYIDAENMRTVRIVSDLDLPAGFPIKMARTTVAYRPMEIAGKSYNLPFESEVRLEDGSHLYVNEIEFRKYHKFSVQSTIHYDGDSQPQQ